MNNEEKILAILGQMQEQINSMGDMMDKKLDPIKQDIADLKQEVHTTNLRIDLMVEPRMDAMVAGQEVIKEKLEHISDHIAVQTEKQSELEYAVKKHTLDIDQLKKAQ